MRSQIASADMARKTGPMIRLVTSSAASVSPTSRAMVPTVSASRFRSATSSSALEFSVVSALKPRATSRTSSTPVSSSAVALRSPSRHRRTTALRAINGGATPRMMRRASGTATARPTIAPTSSIATVVMVARRVVVSTSARPRCRATVRLALSDRKVSNSCFAARWAARLTSGSVARCAPRGRAKSESQASADRCSAWARANSDGCPASAASVWRCAVRSLLRPLSKGWRKAGSLVITNPRSPDSASVIDWRTWALAASAGAISASSAAT